jgi:heme-degrading monooxygenase HmoA
LLEGERSMIARTWHGVTPEDKAEEFLEYVKRTGVPGLGSTPGNLGVMVFRRVEQGRVHFLLTSFWESYDAIASFAGPDIEKARYYPEDERYLIELEPRVTHYEVVVGQEMLE